MVVEVALAGLGLVILLLAGDALVKGAVNLALRLGVPALLVSLTIVAFGTSAPELLIAISAILDGAPGLAIGNVVGSNIANVLLVLGVPALIAGLDTSHCDTRRNYVFMLIDTLLFMALCFVGPLTHWHGFLLLGLLAYVLVDTWRTAKAQRARPDDAASGPAAEETSEDLEGADPSISGWKIGVYLLLGMIGLPLGADLLVDNAVEIATRLNVPETVIGLTLVAIGTSLPELATTVSATLRRQADVALGNVIGSNMFNLLAIIGISVQVGPIPVDPAILSFDLWAMLAATLLLAPFVFTKIQMGKRVGIGLTALYAAYLFVLVT